MDKAPKWLLCLTPMNSHLSSVFPGGTKCPYANRVDPDQTSYIVASDLGFYCLLISLL